MGRRDRGACGHGIHGYDEEGLIMSAHGNLILIFGVFVLYSFIGWGIAELYHEPGYDNSKLLGTFISMNSENQTRCETQTFWENAADDNPDCGALSKYDPFYYIVKFITNLSGAVSMAFNVMIYNNPHIPYLVNVLLITPMNLMMMGAALFLGRGGGS